MSECKAIVSKIRGPLAPILSAVDEQERLDIDSVCRWIDSLIDRGIRLFWTTHGTTHFMCMTDDEIARLTQAVADVTRGRAVFIASTAYHWPADECIAFIERCAGWGVDVVKLQVDWRAWPPSGPLLLEHYRRIAQHSPLPLMAYTLLQPGITPAMLKQIIEIPQFVGLKNDSGDFYEQVAYLRVVEQTGLPFAVMTGGTMESFLHAWHFGAQAFATGTAIYAPEVAIRFYEHLEQGRIDQAAKIVQQVELPLASGWASQGNHWACFHAALYLQGFFKSPRLRFPLRGLDAAQIKQVQVLLEEHGMLAPRSSAAEGHAPSAHAVDRR
ncbi:MAG TPA: dihydrodipicolinate synthase family protein [Phycisphaeraceae bacterium]